MEIPGYRDLTVLGRGGFSVVYRAHQDSMQRDVALKVLAVHMAGADAKDRFRRECATNGRVGTHPNIVTLFDAGFADDGSPYLAMQLCSGGSLSERVRAGGPLAIAEILRVGVKISAALQYAHSAGVLHRDIKPENILISDFGEPELADFGISSVDDQKMSTVTASSFHHQPRRPGGPGRGAVLGLDRHLQPLFHPVHAGRRAHPVRRAEYHGRGRAGQHGDAQPGAADRPGRHAGVIGAAAGLRSVQDAGRPTRGRPGRWHCAAADPAGAGAAGHRVPVRAAAGHLLPDPDVLRSRVGRRRLRSDRDGVVAGHRGDAGGHPHRVTSGDRRDARSGCCVRGIAGRAAAVDAAIGRDRADRSAADGRQLGRLGR